MYRIWPRWFQRWMFGILCRINPPDNWQWAWIAWEVVAYVTTPPDGF